MALIVANSSNSLPINGNPTAGLATALRDFETILSERERLIFRSNYTKPEAADVLVFVSRLDAANKSRARRGVAPRLCKFLDCTVQFTGIVDTFVQANPTISALVWGGVKTALLGASNYASYFDKVTSMMMEISKTCPTYQQFGLLYPNSVELQTALSEYYTTIIHLCAKIIQNSQRSGITQVLSPIFQPVEVEFKGTLNHLGQAAKNIDIQVSLAANRAAREEAQLAEMERRENTSYRKMMALFKADYDRETKDLLAKRIARQTQKLLSEILDEFSSIDYTKSWRQAKEQHLQGTAEWMWNDDMFTEWRTSPKTSILWCSGLLGGGKTIFMSNVVAKILEARRTDDYLVAYYFCRADDHQMLNSRSIIGSLCKQLLVPVISKLTYEQLENFSQSTKDLETEALTQFTFEKLRDKSCYIMIDGLDECNQSEVRKTSMILATICAQQQNKIHLIYSGQPRLEVSLFKEFKPTHKLNISGKHVDEDMKQYINSTLSNYLEDGSLTLKNQQLILHICEKLCAGSNGMFLWAKLVLDELCYCTDDGEIVHALANLPKELTELYCRKLNRIRRQKAMEKSMKILGICCITRRALTVEEMREVMAVEPGQRWLCQEKLPHDMMQLISSCQGLLHVDEQDATVHFIHNSVRQYLTTTFPPHEAVIDPFETELEFGQTCLTYLNFADFERQLTRKEPELLKIDPMVISGADKWKSTKIAQHLLGLKTGKALKPAEISTKLLQTMAGLHVVNSTMTSSEQYHFIVYAKQNWIYHVHSLDKIKHENTWYIFCRLIQQQREPHLITDHFFDVERDTRSLVDFVIENDHPALMQAHIAEFHLGDPRHLLPRIFIQASSRNKYRLRADIMKSLKLPTANEYQDLSHFDLLAKIFDVDDIDGLRRLRNSAFLDTIREEAIKDAVLMKDTNILCLFLTTRDDRFNHFVTADNYIELCQICIQQGDRELMHHLLYVDITFKTIAPQDFQPLLLTAIEHKQVEIFQMLLPFAPRKRIDALEPCKKAIMTGQSEILQMLLPSAQPLTDIDPDLSYIREVIIRDDYKICTLLLEAGYPLKMALYVAIECGTMNMVANVLSKAANGGSRMVGNLLDIIRYTETGKQLAIGKNSTLSRAIERGDPAIVATIRSWAWRQHLTFKIEYDILAMVAARNKATLFESLIFEYGFIRYQDVDEPHHKSYWQLRKAVLTVTNGEEFARILDTGHDRYTKLGRLSN